MRDFFIKNCVFKEHDIVDCQKFGVLFIKANINNNFDYGVYLIEIRNKEEDIIVNIHKTFYAAEFIVGELGLRKGDVIGTDMFNKGDENICEIKIMKKYFFLNVLPNIQFHYAEDSNKTKYITEFLECVKYAIEYVLQTYKTC
jgi:hypothetical protein